MSAIPKGVKPVRKRLADGTVKVLYYHRATKQRLPDDIDSYEFKKRLDILNKQAAEEAERGPQKTISTLIRDYCASQDWLSLAESTRTIGQFDLNAVEAKFGNMPLEMVEQRGSRAVFLEWRDELAAKTPRAADAKLARLARVLAFGLDREHISVNPLATFKRVYNGDRSEIIWLQNHIEAFNAVASARLQMAVMLAYHTGQRRGDILRLKWDQYDGEAISLVQGKTKKEVYIPCTEALKAALDAYPRDGEFILLGRGKKRWTEVGFRMSFDRAFERSKIKDDLHFHDLRGTAVTMLAEAGATVPEIATITGHTLESVNKILERYLSRTKDMARSAIRKLETRLKSGNQDGNRKDVA